MEFKDLLALLTGIQDYLDNQDFLGDVEARELSNQLKVTIDILEREDYQSYIDKIISEINSKGHYL
jgi:hypothetical protein